jgi:hypothetical protein
MKKLALLALFTLTVTAGCNSGGGSGPTASSETLSGTYAIQSMTVSQGGVTVTMTPPQVNGNLIFTPEGTFTGFFSAPNTTTENYAGTYTLDGSVITLNYNDGVVEVWDISPDRSRIFTTDVVEGATVSIELVRG